MKKLIITITLMLGATTVSSSNHSKNYRFPQKDCQEIFAGIGGLIKEADQEWVYLKDKPKNSSDAVEYASKIKWYVGLAANYTTIFEAFCDKD